MATQRRFLLASLWTISTCMILACGGGVPKPQPDSPPKPPTEVPEAKDAEESESRPAKPTPEEDAANLEVERRREAVAVAEAQVETKMVEAGLTEVERRHVRKGFPPGASPVPGAKVPILDISGSVLEGDWGFPRDRTSDGDLTNIMPIDRILGPDEVTVGGGKAWVKGVSTAGYTVDSTIELTGVYVVDGMKDHTNRLNKKMTVPYLVAVDTKRLGSVCAGAEVTRLNAARDKLAESKTEAVRVAAAAREAEVTRRKIAVEREANETREREAEAKAEPRRRAEEARRDREATAEKVTRRNYRKIETGMSVSEVQDILGPGKEAASGPGIQIGTWQSKPKFLEVPTIISITFQDNKVAAKAIIDP